MSGHATEAALLSDTGADVRISSPKAPPISIFDARVPSQPDLSAVLVLEAKQPAAARAIRAQAEQFGGLLREELHSIAGGEAPPSVLLLADLAVSTMVSVQMQRHMTYGAFGQWSEAYCDGASDSKQREGAEKSQRNLAGISVIARDMLIAARAAARDVGAQLRGTGTDGLMRAIGARAPDPVPDHRGGVGSIGAPCALDSLPADSNSQPFPFEEPKP